MNKNTKMIVGVGAVAIVGYLVWKNMSKKPAAAFANLTSSRLASSMLGCPCKAVVKTINSDAGQLDQCAGGQYCPHTGGTKPVQFAGREF